MSKRREQDAVTICMYKVKEGAEATAAESEATTMVSSSHCAWCGDPPDVFGSHSICTSHAQQLIEQAAARRRARDLFLTVKDLSPGSRRVEKPIYSYIEPAVAQRVR